MKLILLLLSLLILMTLAFKGYSTIITAPLLALMTIFFYKLITPNANISLIATYTELYMKGFANFIRNYFPLFLTGSIFAKLMDVSGYGQSIAATITKVFGKKQSILAVILSGALLTYGGVSLFVVAFVLYPIADTLFRQADIPKRLIPGAIALGTFTFTMTALPGSPSVQNVIPISYFGTDTFAAPVTGLIAGSLMFLLGFAWLKYRSLSALKKGEGYSGNIGNVSNAGTIENIENLKNLDYMGMNDSEKEMKLDPAFEKKIEHYDKETLHDSIRENGLTNSGLDHSEFSLKLDPCSETEIEHNRLELSETEMNDKSINYIPNFTKAIFPILLIFAINIFLSKCYYPRYSTTLLAPYNIDINNVTGTWSVILALVFATLAIIALEWNKLGSIKQLLSEGAQACFLPLINSSAIVGYGSVIQSIGIFETIQSIIFKISTNPLVNEALSVNIICGLTASASGGLEMALEAISPQLLQMAATHQISPQLLHRIATLSSGGLDTLPHNGAVITTLTICGLTHKDSYLDIFMTSVMIPVLVSFLMVLVNI